MSTIAGFAARELARLADEVKRYREREEHFARALQVADGGQYRADWDGAIERVIRERDALRRENARLRSRLARVLLTAEDPNFDGGRWVRGRVWSRRRSGKEGGGA